MIGYWFSREDGTTAYQDDPAAIGKTHTCDGEYASCESWLHASPTPWDALGYASGPVLWEVEILGDVVPRGDPITKFSARSRKYVRCVDLTSILRRFAAERALLAAHLWHISDIVREYIQDEARGQDRSDIRKVVQEEPWEIAEKVGRDAAVDAARDTVKATSWAIAQDVAWGEDWNAAWNVAVDEARNRFNGLALSSLQEGIW